MIGGLSKMELGIIKGHALASMFKSVWIQSSNVVGFWVVGGI